LGAFAVFFTQSPSFLAYQRAMTARKGRSNADTLFGLHEIPTDNQIRTLLDPVRPARRVPLLQHGVATVEQPGHLTAVRSWRKRLVVVLDGTQYFSSQKSSGPNCSTQSHANGPPPYSQRRLTPGIVAPSPDKVSPLPPEFIVPQDGDDKQACETAAAKRWRRL